MRNRRHTTEAQSTGLSIRRYLGAPAETWTWPRREYQPAFDYCDADLAFFRRPIGA